MTDYPRYLPDPANWLRTTEEPCQVHRRHIPVSHINEKHHIWPKGMGGPDVAENLVVVCATGHNNIHDLLRAIIRADGTPTEELLSKYARGEQKYAKLGFEWYKRGSLQ